MYTYVHIIFLGVAVHCTELHWQPYIEAHFKGFLAVFLPFWLLYEENCLFVLLCTALHWQPYVEAHFKGWRGHTMWIHDVLCTAQNQDWLLCTYYTIQQNRFKLFSEIAYSFFFSCLFKRLFWNNPNPKHNCSSDSSRSSALLWTMSDSTGRHYVTSKSFSEPHGTYSTTVSIYSSLHNF